MGQSVKKKKFIGMHFVCRYVGNQYISEKKVFVALFPNGFM